MTGYNCHKSPNNKTAERFDKHSPFEQFYSIGETYLCEWRMPASPLTGSSKSNVPSFKQDKDSPYVIWCYMF